MTRLEDHEKKIDALDDKVDDIKVAVEGVYEAIKAEGFPQEVADRLNAKVDAIGQKLDQIPVDDPAVPAPEPVE